MHRRHVLKIAGGLGLVRDVALGGTEHELELRWHFASDLEVRTVSLGRVEVSEPGAVPNKPILSLIAPEETVWATEVSRTLLSPAYGALRPAPLVRCHARVALPAETATALITHGVAIRKDEPRLATMAQAAVQVYELDYHDESHGFFFAPGDQAWSFGPWSSDCLMLYCRIQQEKLSHLVVVGGTYVAWQGQPLLQTLEPSRFFEWRGQNAVTMLNAEPVQFLVTALFEELTGGAGASSASTGGSSTFAEKH
jgi:hypothetical protein